MPPHDRRRSVPRAHGIADERHGRSLEPGAADRGARRPRRLRPRLWCGPASGDAHLVRAADRRLRVQDQEARRPRVPRLHDARAAQFFCDEELRLNRRLAPAIYLDVVAITGSVERPRHRRRRARRRVRGEDARVSAGRAREPDARRGALGAGHVDALAARGRRIPRPRRHARAPARASASPETILRVARQNFDADPAAARRPGRSRAPRCASRVDASASTRRACRLRASARRTASCANATATCISATSRVIDGEVAIFDCIEFNDELRWIDVMSEVAFTAMDLADRGRPDLAHRFLNAYLEITGDYAGLAVFRFYLVYRAMVRAKVACLRRGQLPAGEPKSGARRRIPRLRRPRQPLRAAAASGDRRHARAVRLRQDDAVAGAARVRSARSASAPTSSASACTASTPGRAADRRSTPACTRRTRPSGPTAARWARRGVAAAGGIAIVDGTFLRRWQRDLFRARAAELGLPFAIVAFTASEATLRARIAARARAGDRRVRGGPRACSTTSCARRSRSARRAARARSTSMPRRRPNARAIRRSGARLPERLGAAETLPP